MSVKRKILNGLFSASLIAAPTFGVITHTDALTVLAETRIKEEQEAKVTFEVSGKFEAYQIFTGTYSKEIKSLENGEERKSEVLSNIQWGSGIADPKAFVDELKSAIEFEGAFAEAKSASDVAKVLSAINSNPEKARLFARIAGKNLSDVSKELKIEKEGDSVLMEAGYYLIKDVSAVLGEDDSLNEHVLQVVGDITVGDKKDRPQFDKQIQNVSDATGETEWRETADGYEVGEDVPFLLKAKLPTNFSHYETYDLVFHDTLQSTFDASVLKQESFEVEIDSVKYSEFSFVSDPNNKHSFEIRLEDLQETNATDGSEITVKFSVPLLESAKRGNSGNWNGAYLEFSNDPNWTGTGSGPTGKTEIDEVVDFVFDLEITKRDGTAKDENDEYPKLSKAAFLLEKNVKGDWKPIKEIGPATDLSVFEFKGIGAGEYRITETKTPDGYNSIEPTIFTVETVMIDEENKEELTDLQVKVNDQVITSYDRDGSFSINLENGLIATVVLNEKGTELPSTGGMGTTLLYGVGSVVLVVGAFALILTFRKKEN